MEHKDCWGLSCGESVIPFVMHLSLDWVGWDLHSQSYKEFPDPYQSVLGVTVFNSDNEAAIPWRRFSHWWNCQNPEIVWETRDGKRKLFQEQNKTENSSCLFGEGEVEVTKNKMNLPKCSCLEAGRG